jgi:hypothetical protein
MSSVSNKFWISTVSRDHVRVGIQEGICQVCHGKKAPLARMKKDDWIIYYSPKISMGGKVPCQKFTAIGQIADNNIYQHKMTENFSPFRRNVSYIKNANEVPILPLLDQLSFTQGKKNWGAKFRFGFFEISDKDFDVIRSKMLTNNAHASEQEDGKKFSSINQKTSRQLSMPCIDKAAAKKRRCSTNSEQSLLDKSEEKSLIFKINTEQKTMNIELSHTEFAKSTPENIWSIWSDVSTWSIWDHGLEWCKLKENNKFEVNGEAILQPKGSPIPLSIRFTECTPNKSFTDEGTFELGAIQFSHSVSTCRNGVEITHSFKYIPANPKAKNIFEATMLVKIKDELPQSVKALANYAEKHSENLQHA